MTSPTTSDPATIDSATFRRVLGHYPTGVCVVTAVEPEGGPVGVVVGSFTSVSLDPPLVAFFPDRGSSTWPRIERAGAFCVSVLAKDQHELCRKFSARGGDKFEGVAWHASAGGSPILDGAVAWIDCSLYAVHEAGDHFIALGLVGDLEVHNPNESGPLLFYQGSYGEFSLLL